MVPDGAVVEVNLVDGDVGHRGAAVIVERPFDLQALAGRDDVDKQVLAEAVVTRQLEVRGRYPGAELQNVEAAHLEFVQHVIAVARVPDVDIVTLAALEGVCAKPADQDFVAGGAQQRIRAVGAVKDVAGQHELLELGPGQNAAVGELEPIDAGGNAVDDDELVVQPEAVLRALDFDQHAACLARRAQGVRIIEIAREDHVFGPDALAEPQRVEAVRGAAFAVEQRVVAVAQAEHVGVVALATVQGIVAGAAIQKIVAVDAAQFVVAVAADQDVVAPTAGKQVVADGGDQKAREHIVGSPYRAVVEMKLPDGGAKTVTRPELFLDQDAVVGAGDPQDQIQLVGVIRHSALTLDDDVVGRHQRAEAQDVAC